MPVTMKTRDGGSISSTLNITDLDRLPFYDDIVFLDITPQKNCSKQCTCGFHEFPERLPATLQILKFSGNAFTKLPPLPTTIRAIYGNDNRLCEFPEISHLTSLESVDLS